MWLATTRGFYSVVAHREQDDVLLVRARNRGDIYALAELIPSLRPRRTPKADYLWRAEVSRTEFERALPALVAEIDYPNFKDAVKARQGKARASIYTRVWGVLLGLERRRPAAPPALGLQTRTVEYGEVTDGLRHDHARTERRRAR